MMIVAEVSIEPIGTCDPSYGDIVAACVSALKHQKNIKYDVTAMGTILEGERDSILKAVTDMEDACFKAGAQRVVLNLRIDERHDQPMKSALDMEREVEQKVGHSRSTMRH